MKVGFIGTGHMGNPMVGHLIDAGHELIVHDERPSVTANLTARGASWADSPAAVADACRVVFTSLPGPPQIDAVTRGDNGLLRAARPGDIHVDLSSNSVAMVRQIAASATEHNVRYLDSPVTGGVPGAEKGTVSFLASGDQEAVETVRPLFECMGEQIFYLGEAGNGCIIKLVNNIMVLCTGQFMQEGIVLAAKAGVDPELLDEVLRASTARPFIGLMPYVLGRRFDNPSFTLALAEKDVRLALESADDLAVPMPLTAAAHATYQQALDAGLGDKSFIATLETLEAAADIDVPIRHLDRGRDRL